MSASLYASASLSRRCRRKWRFIVTFRCPRLWVPVRRPFWRPCLRAPSKKVPTKVAFYRHLPVPAVVGPRPKALLAAMSPRSFLEGADESGVSSAPSGARGCGSPSVGPSDGHFPAPLPRRCRRNRRFIVTFRCPRLWVPVCRPF